jgi:integral membrane protein (TIGR00529 family)
VREIAALAAGFLLIIVMIFRKVNIGTTMLTASIVMGLMAGFGPLKVLNVLFASITEEATIRLLTVVIIISILSYLLERFGLLNKMADSLEELFNNNWFSLMFLPLLVGVLSVPGGAVMSAPVVDSVGDKMGIGNVRKAAINVAFRHFAFFLFPFSTTIILATQVSGVSPYTIIKYNAPIGIVFIIAGYMIFIRNSVKAAAAEAVRPSKGLPKRIGEALMYTSPLWVGIVFNLAFGLPFSLALAPGIAIAYFLGGKDKGGFVKGMWQGINWSMIYAVAGIMCLQGFIRQMPYIAKWINDLLESGMDIRMLMVLSSAFLGLLTGNCTAVLGMLLPLFLPLAGGAYSEVYITSLLFSVSFVFYFISPMHLCQVFTTEYFKVNVKEYYWEYRLYWPILFLAIIVLYFFVY